MSIDRNPRWTITANLSSSAVYDAIRNSPNHTRRDITCACHYLAYGRTHSLMSLYSEVLGR